MAGRFSRSLEPAKASWLVVRADKELLLLPVLSVISLVGLRIAWERKGRIFGYWSSVSAG